MRKFRGKLINKYAEEWFYGDLITAKNEDGTVDYYIISEDYISKGDTIELGTCQSPKVEKETIGQSTGLKDKNGIEIYEGDIVKDAWGINMVVKYVNTAFYLCRKNTNGEYTKISNWRNLQSKEVIGNICDNKELLEG